ncbi:MAG: class I SAM-dependent methyltransferase [Terracidiphilus sp.]
MSRSKRLRRRIKSAYFRLPGIYRLYLACKFGSACPPVFREPELPNRVLQSPAELREASEFGRRHRLPLHRSDAKNWDHLAAVKAILSNTTSAARILDAGAEMYSNVLPALYACGYRRLWGMNLSFADSARRGPIQYLRGDITRAGFSDGFFDAVTCMSVIEHGVPPQAYFTEMFRILKPGGMLITSTDYYPEPIDTGGKAAHGAPIQIFCRRQAEAMIALAQECGFEATGAIDLSTSSRLIRWEEYNLEYTFLIFTLRKPAGSFL